MCIYCTTNNYRKIYENHNGIIPKDSDGRTYEIHHINGNHSNNDPSNLKAVTLQEHYDIHYANGDWAACLLMSDRMKISPEEKSKLASFDAQQRVKNGTHHFLGDKNPNHTKVKNGTHPWLGGEQSRKNSQKMVEEGIHPFLGGDVQRKMNQERIENNTHPFMKRLDGSSLASDRVKQGSHPLLGGAIQRQMIADGTSPSQAKWTCEHCNISGKGKGNYTKNHGDNCKVIKPRPKRKSYATKSCPHCGIVCSPAMIGRHHGIKCKSLLQINVPFFVTVPD
jgi:hypothetical protein